MQGDLYLLGEDAGRVWLEDTEAERFLEFWN
ncbi:hypothetical protein PM3016_5698 [Paenibacillus mucilaginosus 3016]|uniref:Uncharacterized protein n=2 Tax=Paenibacillus mucilaginosus TaxID=61624 RepID=H6NKI9_9BACL|nr:hypothetical protein PM3016_5698 [Paenibacillus mucilaginosus 3016]AFH64690.1 hypothetical protein B2K_29000 [Paenibacillus mucilaginosus K02]